MHAALNRELSMLEPVDSLLSMNSIEKQADHQIVILIAPSHYRSDGPLARPVCLVEGILSRKSSTGAIKTSILNVQDP